MQLVALVAADGKHIGFTVIRPYRKPPDVLVWGERYFRPARSDESIALSTDGESWLYVETTAVTFAVSITPGKVS